MSIRPKVSTAFATTLDQFASSKTSNRSYRASYPCDRICSADAFPLSSWMSVMTTLPPSSRIFQAAAPPNPMRSPLNAEAEPVSRATLFSNLFVMLVTECC